MVTARLDRLGGRTDRPGWRGELRCDRRVERRRVKSFVPAFDGARAVELEAAQAQRLSSSPASSTGVPSALDRPLKHEDATDAVEVIVIPPERNPGREESTSAAEDASGRVLDTSFESLSRDSLDEGDSPSWTPPSTPASPDASPANEGSRATPPGNGMSEDPGGGARARVVSWQADEDPSLHTPSSPFPASPTYTSSDLPFHDGSGGGNGGTGTAYTREDDGGGRPVVLGVVYTVFAAVMCLLWRYVHVIMMRPEVIEKQIQVLLDRHKRRLRSKKLVMGAVLPARHRTVCVYTAGHRYSTRRIVAPAESMRPCKLEGAALTGQLFTMFLALSPLVQNNLLPAGNNEATHASPSLQASPFDSDASPNLQTTALEGGPHTHVAHAHVADSMQSIIEDVTAETPSPISGSPVPVVQFANDAVPEGPSYSCLDSVYNARLPDRSTCSPPLSYEAEGLRQRRMSLPEHQVPSADDVLASPQPRPRSLQRDSAPGVLMPASSGLCPLPTMPSPMDPWRLMGCMVPGSLEMHQVISTNLSAMEDLAMMRDMSVLQGLPNLRPQLMRSSSQPNVPVVQDLRAHPLPRSHSMELA